MIDDVLREKQQPFSPHALEMLESKPRSYREYVAALSSRNPCLLNLLSFLFAPKASTSTCQIIALDVHERSGMSKLRPVSEGKLLQELQGIVHPSDLPREDHEQQQMQGRILLIEDLTADLIELLGSALDIDPLFFALHIHTTQRNDTRSQTPDVATLPSRLVAQDYISTTYHRPLVCDNLPPGAGRFVRDMTISRKLVFVRSTNIGLAQHCVSTCKVRVRDDFWIALLLVDPPMGDLYHVTDRVGSEKMPVRLDLRPYLGMYEDFLPSPKFSDVDRWTAFNDTPRGGMATEICHYWNRSVPPDFEPRDPSLESLAYFPLKVVAAEWAKYIAVMTHCIKLYEYQGDQLPRLEQFNTDLRELQGWRRRSMLSQIKVRSLISQLEARVPSTKSSPDLQHLIQDFKTIDKSIKNSGRRLENMLPVVTSLVQIIDARQSFAETTNISRLTVLALVFVPLSFVSSVFSMNPQYGPGGHDFRVYFFVAIPITVLVFAVARPPTTYVAKLSELLRMFKSPSKPKPQKIATKTYSKDGPEA